MNEIITISNKNSQSNNFKTVKFTNASWENNGKTASQKVTCEKNFLNSINTIMQNLPNCINKCKNHVEIKQEFSKIVDEFPYFCDLPESKLTENMKNANIKLASWSQKAYNQFLRTRSLQKWIDYTDLGNEPVLYGLEIKIKCVNKSSGYYIAVLKFVKKSLTVENVVDFINKFDGDIYKIYNTVEMQSILQFVKIYTFNENKNINRTKNIELFADSMSTSYFNVLIDNRLKKLNVNQNNDLMCLNISKSNFKKNWLDLEKIFYGFFTVNGENCATIKQYFNSVFDSFYVILTNTKTFNTENVTFYSGYKKIGKSENYILNEKISGEIVKIMGYLAKVYINKLA